MNKPDGFRFGFARVILSAALLLAGRAAFAQATVELQVEEGELEVNQPFVVQVIVDNFQKVETPVLPQTPDFKIQPQGQGDSENIDLIRGVRQRRRTFQYEFIATQPGNLAIPPISVTVDGVPLKTRPQKVLINKSVSNGLFWSEIVIERKRLYSGQRIRAVLRIWVKPAAVGERKLSAESLRQQIRGSLGPFGNSPVRVATMPYTNDAGETTDYYVFELPADLTVEQTGKLSFDDIALTMRYPTKFGRDIFGEVAISAARTIRTTPRVGDVEVVALPAEGRPDDFTGAVGTFRISAAATPTSVRVGDPIELRIELAGEGVLATLPAPLLHRNRKLAEGFRVPQEALAGEVIGERKRFTQTIRALSADVREIPPIGYSYFDPDQERYITTESAAIPLTVAAAPELDASAVPSPSVERPTAAVESVDGLRGNVTRPERLLRTTTPISPALAYAALLAPPAVYAAVFGMGAVVAYRRQHSPQRRRQNAGRRAHRRLDEVLTSPEGTQASTVRTVLAEYLADRQNAPPTKFFGEAGAELLRSRGASAALVERWAQVIRAAEESVFAGGAAVPADVLVNEARNCIQEAERVAL